MKKHLAQMIPLAIIKPFTFMFIFCSIVFAGEDVYQAEVLSPFWSIDKETVALNPKYFGTQNFMLACDEGVDIISCDDFFMYYRSYVIVFGVLLECMKNDMNSQSEFNIFNREFRGFYNRYYQKIYNAYQKIESEFLQDDGDDFTQLHQKVLAFHKLFFEDVKAREQFFLNTIDNARDLHSRLSDIIFQNS